MKSYLKLICTLILMSTISNSLLAQSQRKPFFEIGGVSSFGFDHQTINYISQSGDNLNLPYSGGGGIGLQLGLGVFLNKNWILRTDLQYQVVLAGQIENYNGVKTQSTAVFSRATISPGLYYSFSIPEKYFIKGVELGAHLDYNLPGALKITENNTKLEDTKFKNALGYRFKTLGLVQLKKDRNLYATFGAGFRVATNYMSKTTNQPDLDGSGLDFSLGLRWYIGQR